MEETMTLDPQALAFFEAGRAEGLPRLDEISPQEARSGSRELAELIGAGPAVETVEDVSIPLAGAEIAARRYRPAGAHGTIVWLHGGGWVLGSIETSDAMCRILAEQSRATVLSVDYRLAPEHPFPVGLEDSFAALVWAAEHESGPLVVGGDSAGGNLAGVCALRARDRGGPELAAQLLIYPVTDTDTTTPSYREHDGEAPPLLLGTREMVWFFGHYLPNAADRENPEVAPLRASDLSGLPPAIVVIAEYDPLRDDGARYAERLREAGVEVTLQRYDDQPHGFFGFVNVFPKGNVAVASVGAWVRGVLDGDE
jgi:acetyl esterase